MQHLLHWPRTMKAPMLALAVSAALLMAACGSQPTGEPPLGAGQPKFNYQHLVEFAACMRGHGMPEFPDPSPFNGQTPGSGQHLVFGNEEFSIPSSIGPTMLQAGMNACHSLIGVPASLDPSGTQLTAKEKRAWVSLAACMRTHGFPTFPDPEFGRSPSLSGTSQPGTAVVSMNGATFYLGPSVDPRSARFHSAFSTCRQNAGLAGAELPGTSRVLR